VVKNLQARAKKTDYARNARRRTMSFTSLKKVKNDPTRNQCKKCGSLEDDHNDEVFNICDCMLGNFNFKKFRTFLASDEFKKICIRIERGKF